MKRYKGYYIDGVIFKNEQEIDKSIQLEIIRKLKIFSEMFMSDRYNMADKFAILGEIDSRETRLHDEYNMDWEKIENIPWMSDSEIAKLVA